MSSVRSSIRSLSQKFARTSLISKRSPHFSISKIVKNVYLGLIIDYFNRKDDGINYHTNADKYDIFKKKLDDYMNVHYPKVKETEYLHLIPQDFLNIRGIYDKYIKLDPRHNPSLDPYKFCDKLNDNDSGKKNYEVFIRNYRQPPSIVYRTGHHYDFECDVNAGKRRKRSRNSRKPKKGKKTKKTKNNNRKLRRNKKQTVKR
jgi:hypothetical protein